MDGLHSLDAVGAAWGWPMLVGCCNTESEGFGKYKSCSGESNTGTYKFLRAREVKQLHQAEVISRDDVQASVGHTGTVDICFICISWPDPNDFVSENAVPKPR